MSTINNLIQIEKWEYLEYAQDLFTDHLIFDPNNYNIKITKDECFALDPHFMRLSEILGESFCRKLIGKIRKPCCNFKYSDYKTKP